MEAKYAERQRVGSWVSISFDMNYTRWWFHFFIFFNFHAPAKMIQFDPYFSIRLKPPPSIWYTLNLVIFWLTPNSWSMKSLPPPFLGFADFVLPFSVGGNFENTQNDWKSWPLHFSAKRNCTVSRKKTTKPVEQVGVADIFSIDVVKIWSFASPWEVLQCEHVSEFPRGQTNVCKKDPNFW